MGLVGLVEVLRFAVSCCLRPKSGSSPSPAQTHCFTNQYRFTCLRFGMCFYGSCGVHGSVYAPILSSAEKVLVSCQTSSLRCSCLFPSECCWMGRVQSPPTYLFLLISRLEVGSIPCVFPLAVASFSLHPFPRNLVCTLQSTLRALGKICNSPFPQVHTSESHPLVCPPEHIALRCPLFPSPLPPLSVCTSVSLQLVIHTRTTPQTDWWREPGSRASWGRARALQTAFLGSDPSSSFPAAVWL